MKNLTEAGVGLIRAGLPFFERFRQGDKKAD